MRDEDTRLNPEGGGHLGRVEHPHAARCPGAEIVHPAACPQTIHDAVDDSREGGQRRRDRAGHRGVLGVQQPQDVLGGHDVDVGGPPVAFLRAG
jgi:hypothetical protein